MIFLKNTIIIASTLLGIGEASKGARILDHRNDANPPNMTDIICKNPDFGWAPTQHLSEGVTYLKGKTGDLTIGWQDGGGYCSRLSCSYDSAIYLCNDNEYSVTTDFPTVVQYAQYILDYTDTGNDTACVWVERDIQTGGKDKQVAWGQVFDSNGFNVILGIHEWTSC